MTSEQDILIHALMADLQRRTGPVQLYETHISWVIVAGNEAYKFKKAVRLDFLDTSTLAARHFYCQEELRLNRRLAPDIYLDVVTITGTATQPSFDAAGTPIEYAVRMRAFSQQALWCNRIRSGDLGAAEIDELAHKLASFHMHAAVADRNSPWSGAEAVQKVASENLGAIATLVEDAEQTAQVNALLAWQCSAHQTLAGEFDARKTRGFVRECHGDLHSANIITIDGAVAVFDCIEFNPGLRWIDVMSDLAFICMDLSFHGLAGLAARLRNTYLELTGDYDGVAVLAYYQTQRALVRCKVAQLRAGQLANDRQAACPQTLQAAQEARQAASYLAFARASIETAPVALIIMHGFSGSGKSVFSQTLLELAGAVRIRSDVERKRLHAVAPVNPVNADGTPPGAAGQAGSDLYSSAAIDATYSRLQLLARQLIQARMPVIVDATFLKHAQRRRFARLATELGVPFFIVAIAADHATLQSRVVARSASGVDPSEANLAVLAHQLANHDPLDDDEQRHLVSIDSQFAADLEAVHDACAPILADLHNA